MKLLSATTMGNIFGSDYGVQPDFIPGLYYPPCSHDISKATLTGYYYSDAGVRASPSVSHSHVQRDRPTQNRKMFGTFKCPNCRRKWFSSNAWDGVGQNCVKCNTLTLPCDLAPLKKPEHDVIDIRKPHPAHLCEKCRRLGYSCTQLLHLSNK